MALTQGECARTPPCRSCCSILGAQPFGHVGVNATGLTAGSPCESSPARVALSFLCVRPQIQQVGPWELRMHPRRLLVYGPTLKYPNEVPEARSTCEFSAEQVHQVLVANLWAWPAAARLPRPRGVER